MGSLKTFHTSINHWTVFKQNWHKVSAKEGEVKSKENARAMGEMYYYTDVFVYFNL